jgi:hypothetical protein
MNLRYGEERKVYKVMVVNMIFSTITLVDGNWRPSIARRNLSGRESE